MLYYTLPLVFFYAMFGIGYITKRPVVWTVIGAAPMIALILFRGNIGTDTPVYIKYIELIRESKGELPQVFEPLFEFILYSLGFLPIASWAILALVSLSTMLLFFKGWTRIEPSLIIFTGLYSQFFVDMTMNGVRYGLAFSLIIFGSRYLLERKFYIFLILVLAAAFIQISSVLLAVLLYFFHEQRWRTAIYGIILGCLIGLTFSDRLLLKLAAYELEYNPSHFSGIMPLISMWLNLAIWSLDPRARKEAAGKIVGILILSIASYGLAQITYAGLRFLQLTLFLSALTFACHLYKNNIQISHRSTVLLLALGVVFGILKLRHYSEIIDAALANYIPYQFYWE